MKRIISAVLAIMMVFSLGLTALAAELEISVAKRSVAKGEEVALTISTDEAFSAAMFQLEYKYDTAKFEFVKSAWGAGNAALPNATVVDAAGIVQVNFINFMGVVNVAKGEICTITFKAKEDIANFSNAGFEVGSFGAANAAGQPISEIGIATELKLPAPKTYNVTYTGDVTGPKAVEEGATLEFTVGDAAHYDYKVTVNGKEVTGTNGKYTVANVNADVAVVATKTGKPVTVDVDGTAKDHVVAAATATYGQPFTFSVNMDEHFDYLVYVNGEEVTLTNGKYTIASVGDEVVIRVHNNPKTYTVTLPDLFTGENSVQYGNAYTFTAKDKNFAYDFAGSTMAGKAFTPKDNGDGTYTISIVTGDVVIKAAKAGKPVAVTVTGNAAAEVDKGTAIYDKQYVFTISEDTHYNYEVTVNGTKVTGTNGRYTVAKVTGDIAIVANKTAKEYKITLPEDFTGADEATYNTSYTFTAKDPNLFYTFNGSTMGGGAATVMDNGDGTYTIEKVTGDVVIKCQKLVPAYIVTIDRNEFNAPERAKYNEDYTFSVKNKQYSYTFNEAYVVDNGDGTYTVKGENVHGPFTVSVKEKTAAKYDVAVKGNAAADITAEAKATYGTDYSFKLVPASEGYKYTVKVTVGGKAVTPEVKDNVYTIAGTAITGKVEITATRAGQEYAATVEGNAKADVTASKKANFGIDYTFAVNEKEGYKYTVSATVGGKAVELTRGGVDNKDYIIKGEQITGNIVVTVAKEVITFNITVTPGVELTNAERKVEYGKNFVFEVKEDDDKVYFVEITGAEYTVVNGKYTVKEIKADVTINVEVMEIPENEVKVEKNEYLNDAPLTAEKGQDFTFEVLKRPGYNYTVTVTVDGKSVAVKTNEDGSYTIGGADVTGVIEVKVTETKPTKPDDDDDKENPGVTITDPNAGETNPNTGAPVAAFAAMAVLGAAAMLGKRK